jgi:Domain of unknown function (DUF4157)
MASRDEWNARLCGRLLRRHPAPAGEFREGLEIPIVGLEGGRVPPAISSAIRRARGGGRSLERGLREQMGTRLGYDFRGVRIHDASEASDLNRLLGARAFTIGSDIFFGQGAYDPDSPRGRELIAHELIHVVQQGGDTVMGPEGAMIVRPAGDLLEQEADAMAGPIAGLERRSSSLSPERRIARGAGAVPRRVQRVIHPSTGPAQIQRALAFEALAKVPPVPNVTMTCHVATWFWAAQEAQNRGLTSRKLAADRLGDICTILPQPAMLKLPRAATWDFKKMRRLPPPGTVLLWTAKATHSAVVTPYGAIAGYNQVDVFTTRDIGLTSCTLDMLDAKSMQCITILEDTIVNTAGILHL